VLYSVHSDIFRALSLFLFLVHLHLISKVQIDTVSTMNVLRREVRRLDEKTSNFGGNITKFNEYVKRIVIALALYNENCPELLLNLFDAYCTIDDSDFHAYILNKRTNWEDGTYYPTVTSIMMLVENNYKMRVQNGTWNNSTSKKTTSLR
jgi:hypothetical protein